MFAKRFACGFLAALLLALCGGCQQSSSSANKPSTNQLSTINSQPSAPPALSLHWLGMKQIAADTNKPDPFVTLWNLPETVKLKDQTLDKLAAYFSTNFPSALNPQLSTNAVRPLLNDLVQEEWYLEANEKPAGSNAASAFSLTIRLNDERAALWQTNLSPVLSTNLTLSRSNGWTVLASSAAFTSPVTRHPSLATNAWLEANFDLNRLASQDLKSLLTTPQTPDLPVVSLTFAGDGHVLRTRGQLTFDKPLPLQLEPWAIPTNIVSSPFSSFTAVRGVQPWLGSLKGWNDLQIGAPPNQIYIWAAQAFLAQTLFAAPEAGASNQVAKLTDLVLQKCNQGNAADGLVKFGRAADYNGLAWRGLPMLSPFLKSISTNGSDFVFGGTFQVPNQTNPIPAELLNELCSRTNLVLYDSEITGPRVEQWISVAQFLRLASHRTQLPGDSVGMAWLRALMPRLDNSVTAVMLTAPDRLSFTRASRIGFTAVELHLLADWLESPSFPKGLLTFAAQPAE